MRVLTGPARGRLLEVVRGLVAPLDPALAACTRVPPAGPGVCASCHAACRMGPGEVPDGGLRARCLACRRTAGQVMWPAAGITPISLFQSGDDLWYLLRRYKDGARAAERHHCRRALARLLSQFLRFHLACAAPEASDGWVLTAVPSTRRRRERLPMGRFPMERVIRCSPWLRRRYRRTLVTAAAPGHNRADDRAFAVVGDVAGAEIVLVDDTYTTGASVQSAASALQRAGARVVGVVVIGRVVNPAIPAEARLWAEATRQPFRLDRCCHCGAAPARRAPLTGQTGGTQVPAGTAAAPGKLVDIT